MSLSQFTGMRINIFLGVKEHAEGHTAVLVTELELEHKFGLIFFPQ